MLFLRHDSELKETMALVSSSRASEEDLAMMMREHERDRTVLEAQWGGELRKLRETQRNSYQQWIAGAYKEMTSPGETNFPRGVICDILIFLNMNFEIPDM